MLQQERPIRFQQAELIGPCMFYEFLITTPPVYEEEMRGAEK